MSPSLRPSPPWTHHPVWYDKDCGRMYLTYLSEDGYLFRVAIACLRRHSEYVRSMETVAYNDGNPMFLPNMKSLELEQVFAWLSHEWQGMELSKGQLISLLRAGRFFMMPSLMQWVLRELQELKEPPNAIEKLAISQELPILHEAWIRPAVGALVLTPLETFHSLSSDIATQLDSTVIMKISLARQTVTTQRMILAFSYHIDDSISPGSGCDWVKHFDICFPGWSIIWWSDIAQKILNPSPSSQRDDYIEDLRDLPKVLRQTNWKDIPCGCVEAFICYLESTGAFNVEQEIVDGVTEAVTTYLRSLHMNWKEFDFSDNT
ncbi:MAG: hypothetical protein NXY57DRAFT_966021 [Lentinula lateritia]|nr:MAG: hypothetical protein NXY57DRAFT_966021 [Lentinula lateritia]